MTSGSSGHGGHCFDGVFAVGCLAAEHQRIGVLVDGVGDIGHLGAGRPGILDHRVEHLGGDDNRLLGLDTLLDKTGLYAGNLLLRHLDAQVATGHHHAVCRFEYLVDVVDTLLVLDFGNNLDGTFVLVENGLYVKYILFAAHEGVGDKVDVLLDGIVNVANVALGERGEVDAHARHVDTLAGPQLAIIERFAQQVAVLFTPYYKFKFAVVDENMAAFVEVLGKEGIVDPDIPVAGEGALPAGNAHEIAGRELQVAVACESRGAHLGTLGVHQDGYFVGDGTHVVDDFAESLFLQVGRVHAHDIHAVVVELLDKVDVATRVGDSGYYFGVFGHSEWWFIVVFR